MIYGAELPNGLPGRLLASLARSGGRQWRENLIMNATLKISRNATWWTRAVLHLLLLLGLKQACAALDYAPDTIAGDTVVITITNDNGTVLPPMFHVSVTNVFGTTTFAQTGPPNDTNNTYSGTYTYTKTGTNTGTIRTVKTTPVSQAGETATNRLTFSGLTNGTVVHTFQFPDSSGTQSGPFRVTVYVPSGSLQVAIDPSNAVNAGAQWQVDGGPWQNSSNLVHGLSVGSHTVAYNTISGWSTPGSQTVVITTNTTTVTNGTYTSQTGSLQVTISPAGAISAGAQWQVDGGDWQNSGAVVGGLAVGGHTVAYKSSPGWAQPGNQSVTVAVNSTTVTNGSFVASDFTVAFSNGAFIITGYTGAGGGVTIPGIINGLPVTGIGDMAFLFRTSITDITIPNSVTNIGVSAFSGTGLTSVMIPNSVTKIGMGAFSACSSLTRVVLPDSVTLIEPQAFQMCGALTDVSLGNRLTQIGNYAFEFCTSLGSIVTPSSLTNVGDYAFSKCFNLAAVYAKGNAPGGNAFLIFADSPFVTLYYLPGTSGWVPPAVLWNPTITTAHNFGIRSNRFGFNITGTADLPIVVETTSNLAGSVWIPLLSSLLTNGSVYFSDAQWTNYPKRYYRVRSP